MLKLLSAILVISVTSSFAFANNCSSNQKLAGAGWSVHNASEFASVAARTNKELNRSDNGLVLDMQSRMRSKATEGPVEVTSYDRLSTPQELMFGDVLTIVELETGHQTEIRWFDGQRKHVVYNTQFQKCAMDMIPFATNALF